MAARSARGIASAVNRSLGGSRTRLFSFEISPVALFNRPGGFEPRFASSSSMPWPSTESLSSSSSTVRKADKKMSDRLSGVIDAVNDRKLPPELRGQRNAVRSETDIINVVEQRIWQSMEEGTLKTYQGRASPWISKLTPMLTLPRTPYTEYSQRTTVHRSGLSLTRRYAPLLLSGDQHCRKHGLTSVVEMTLNGTNAQRH